MNAYSGDIFPLLVTAGEARVALENPDCALKQPAQRDSPQW